MAETWFYWRSGENAAAANMAGDEALLESIGAIGRPVLRFYGWREPAATFGYSQRFAEVMRWTPLRPLIRRPTGGGLVPHDADWTYSLAVPPGHAWYALHAQDSYRRIHEWVRAALAACGLATRLASIGVKAAPGQCFVGAEQFDVLWQERKLAGAAQRRNRLGLLIQGSIQPRPAGLACAAWEQAMMDTVATLDGARVAWAELQLLDSLRARAHQLAREKYSRAEFNERR